jgi:hypothetical protein
MEIRNTYDRFRQQCYSGLSHGGSFIMQRRDGMLRHDESLFGELLWQTVQSKRSDQAPEQVKNTYSHILPNTCNTLTRT